MSTAEFWFSLATIPGVALIWAVLSIGIFGFGFEQGVRYVRIGIAPRTGFAAPVLAVLLTLMCLEYARVLVLSALDQPVTPRPIMLGLTTFAITAVAYMVGYFVGARRQSQDSGDAEAITQSVAAVEDGIDPVDVLLSSLLNSIDPQIAAQSNELIHDLEIED
jgi:hypothetical protein